jgi:hypothetical protein
VPHVEPPTFSRPFQAYSWWGIIGAHADGLECRAPRGARDYFRELGVRPFINASGTHTAMTASLMPREVMDAINYASRHYVMLEELQLQGWRAHRDARQGGSRDGDLRRGLALTLAWRPC